MAIGSYQLSVGIDLKGATTALKGFNNQLKAAQKPARDFQNQLKQFGRVSGLSDIGKAASSAASKIGIAGKAMAGFVGPASVAGLADMIKGFADMSQQVENLSSKLGIASDKLQALHGAGKLTGLGGAFERTTQGVQDVQRAYNNGTASAGQQAAISSMGLNGRMSTDDYTKKALQRTQNDMAHGMSAATARARLSDAGVDPALMGLIKQGKDVGKTYDDLMAKSNKLLRTSQTNTQWGSDMAEAFKSVSLAVEGFGNAIGSKLAPVLTPMLNNFANWLATSPQANEMINQISDGIANFAKWIGSINWQGIASGAQTVFNAVGGLKGIFEGLVAVKVVGWATTAISVGTKLFQTFRFLAGASALTGVFEAVGAGVAAIAAPFAVAVAAVAALGVAAYELYQHWDTVGPYFRATWDTVKDIFSGVAKWLQPATDTIGSIFTTMWDGIKSTFSTAWDYISPIFDKIKGAFDWIAHTSIGKKMGLGYLADDFSKNLTNEKQITADSIAARSDNSPAQVPAGVRAGGATGGGYKKAPDEVAALESQGLSHANAVGYAANIMKESNFNPFAVGDNGNAYGLGQWHKDRQLAYAKMFGHTMQSVTDADQARREQTQFYVAESKTATGGHVFQKLQGNNDVGVAAATVSRDFERPANQLGEMGDRARIAMNINNQSLKENNALLAKATQSNQDLAQANTKQVQTQAQVASATINNNTTTTEKVQHSVDINVGDGRITAKAKSGGGGLTIAPPKVQKVMPSIIV